MRDKIRLVSTAGTGYNFSSLKKTTSFEVVFFA